MNSHCLLYAMVIDASLWRTGWPSGSRSLIDCIIRRGGHTSADTHRRALCHSIMMSAVGCTWAGLVHHLCYLNNLRVEAAMLRIECCIYSTARFAPVLLCSLTTDSPSSSSSSSGRPDTTVSSVDVTILRLSPSFLSTVVDDVLMLTCFTAADVVDEDDVLLDLVLIVDGCGGGMALIAHNAPYII